MRPWPTPSPAFLLPSGSKTLSGSEGRVSKALHAPGCALYVLPLIPALNCPLKRKKAIGCSSPVSSSCSQETMGVERMALPRSGLRRWLIYQDQTGARPPEPLLFGVVAASSRCLSPPQLPTVFELLLPQLKHSCQHVPLCPRPFTSKGAWGSTRLRLSGRGLPGPSTRWSHSPPDNSRGSFFCICLSAHSK